MGSVSKHHPILWLACILTGVWLAACSPALPNHVETGATTPAATSPVGASPAAASQMPLPSATPTAQPPRAVLLASPASDPALVSALQPILADLAAQSGLDFQTKASLSPDEIEGLRLVVALPPDPGLAQLAAAAPKVQFLGVGITGLQAKDNISKVDIQGGRPDQQAFLAGYLAAVITSDWRIGVIGLQGAPAGKVASQAFTNGAVFFCGLCRPVAPPFVQYPVSVELPSNAGQAEQQAAAESLASQGVNTVFIAPEVQSQALLEALAQKKMGLIGTVPPPAGVKDHWVASIQSNWLDAVRQAWPSLLQGKGGVSLSAPLKLETPNPALLSPGRQRLVEQTLADLSAGFVDTGVDPATGERR